MWPVSHMLLTVMVGNIACKINYTVVYMHMSVTTNRILNDFLKKETHT